MNCRKGDLAIIVRSLTGKSVGKILRCVELSVFNGTRKPDGTINPGPVWKTDASLKGWDGSNHNFVHDAYLRPIRDPGDDATDEMIQRLGSPNKQEQKA